MEQEFHSIRRLPPTLFAEVNGMKARARAAGGHGDGHVRLALVENARRIRQAARNIKTFLGGPGEAIEGTARKRAAVR